MYEDVVILDDFVGFLRNEPLVLVIVEIELIAPLGEKAEKIDERDTKAIEEPGIDFTHHGRQPSRDNRFCASEGEDLRPFDIELGERYLGEIGQRIIESHELALDRACRCEAGVLLPPLAIVVAPLEVSLPCCDGARFL